MARTFPLALVLTGRRVLVVGGGPVALEKACGLVESGARVVVVAPDVLPELAAIADHVDRRCFLADDVWGAWLVIAAAPPAVNREVRLAADAQQTFMVAVDDTEACTAQGMARIHRGDVTLAIGTGGRAPALAAVLRRVIEESLPDDLDAWADIARGERERWKAGFVPLDQRRARLARVLLKRLEAQAAKEGP